MSESTCGTCGEKITWRDGLWVVHPVASLSIAALCEDGHVHTPQRPPWRRLEKMTPRAEAT